MSDDKPLGQRARKKLRSSCGDSLGEISEEQHDAPRMPVPVAGSLQSLLPQPVSLNVGDVKHFLPPTLKPQTVKQDCQGSSSYPTSSSTLAGCDKSATASQAGPQILVALEDVLLPGTSELTLPIPTIVPALNQGFEIPHTLQTLPDTQTPLTLPGTDLIVPLCGGTDRALDKSVFYLSYSDEPLELSTATYCTTPPISPPASPAPASTPGDPTEPSQLPTEDSTETTGDSSSSSGSTEPLYNGSPYTVHDCMVSILTYSVKNRLSGASTAKLIDLISTLLPQPNNLPQSSYLFKKYFKDDQNELLFYYYCSNCWSSRVSFHDLCDKCTVPNRKVTYFLSCPLEPQLQRLYSRKGFCDMLKYKYTRVKENKDNIEDLYDGALYKEEEKGFLSNPNNISFMFYTDGVAMFECSTYSVWPCIYTINELPPAERYKAENILIGGLWGGDCKPHPNVFLLPMYYDLKKVQEGILLRPYGSENFIKVCGKLLFGTCDMPAKATFMNMKSHNGYWSCAKCLIKGEKSERTGQVMVFPHQDHLELRTDENFQNCVQEGVKNKDGYKGVFGPSLLSFMFCIPIVSALCIDVMHCCHMGIQKQLMKLWFDPKYKDCPFSLVDKIPIVNRRLLSLQLPEFVQRLPIDVSKNLCYVKASLCRNYFYYIFLIVLRDILPLEFYENFCDLVEGVALLNKSSISSDDIKNANMLLIRFSKNFQRLYGLRHMTSNIHLLLHLSQTVFETGNLFHSSCYYFEDLNGQLCALVHGTRHAIAQISSKLRLLQDLPLLVNTVTSHIAKDLCERLMEKTSYTITEKICSKTYVVGPISVESVHSKTVTELVSPLYANAHYLVYYFDKLSKFRKLYVASSYPRGARNSTVCRYDFSGTSYHGKILTFVKVVVPTNVPNYFALILRSTDVPIGLPRHSEFVTTEIVDLVPVHGLKCVSFLLAVEGQEFVVDPLNPFEIE